MPKTISPRTNTTQDIEVDTQTTPETPITPSSKNSPEPKGEKDSNEEADTKSKKGNKKKTGIKSKETVSKSKSAKRQISARTIEVVELLIEKARAECGLIYEFSAMLEQILAPEKMEQEFAAIKALREGRSKGKTSDAQAGQSAPAEIDTVKQRLQN